MGSCQSEVDISYSWILVSALLIHVCGIIFCILCVKVPVLKSVRNSWRTLHQTCLCGDGGHSSFFSVNAVTETLGRHKNILSPDRVGLGLIFFSQQLCI